MVDSEESSPGGEYDRRASLDLWAWLPLPNKQKTMLYLLKGLEGKGQGVLRPTGLRGPSSVLGWQRWERGEPGSPRLALRISFPPSVLGQRFCCPSPKPCIAMVTIFTSWHLQCGFFFFFFGIVLFFARASVLYLSVSSIVLGPLTVCLSFVPLPPWFQL